MHCNVHSALCSVQWICNFATDILSCSIFRCRCRREVHKSFHCCSKSFFFLGPVCFLSILSFLSLVISTTNCTTPIHPSTYSTTVLHLRCRFRKLSPSQQLVWSSSSHRNWRPIYVGSWNLQLMRRSSHRSLSLPPIAVCNTCALSPIVDVPDQQCAGEEVTCFL